MHLPEQMFFSKGEIAKFMGLHSGNMDAENIREGGARAGLNFAVDLPQSNSNSQNKKVSGLIRYSS